MEDTNLYWFHLACFLKDSLLLSGLEHEVYALDPKLVAGFKKAYPNLGKTAPLDAFFIAERLRLGRLPAPFQADLLYGPLQRLTRFRVHLASTVAREKNYFLSLLFHVLYLLSSVGGKAARRSGPAFDGSSRPRIARG